MLEKQLKQHEKNNERDWCVAPEMCDWLRKNDNQKPMIL